MRCFEWWILGEPFNLKASQNNWNSELNSTEWPLFKVLLSVLGLTDIARSGRSLWSRNSLLLPFSERQKELLSFCVIMASQRDYGRIVAVRLEHDFYLMRLTSKMQTEHFLNPQGQERSILQVATQAKLFCEWNSPFFETRQACWSRNCHGNLMEFGGGGGGGTSGG